MTIEFDRRLLIKAAALGLGVLSTPGAAALLGARGFTHGVASGEPAQHSVLLWTRYAGAQDTALRAELSETLDFARIADGGEAVADPARDHTAKITVSGLAPDRYYYYRFVAPDGTMSAVGRTRTLPEGETGRFALAVFSCSNLPFGHFNAYAHAARRPDIDLALHLGDYLYEYETGKYPRADQALRGRAIFPDHETVSLADYRLRHAAYRSDPDLQRLHQLHPMVAMWDDHEFANDAWKAGAENHQPESEGDWMARRRAAERAYREWMPVADLAPGAPRWTSYRIGDLATIYRTESRVSARNEQMSLAAFLAGRDDLPQALVEFRDTVWQDPDREMLGARQQSWLAGEMAAADTRWQLLAQQCVMGPLKLPPQTLDWVPRDAPDFVWTRARAGAAAARAGLPFNLDAWDGYPAARDRLLRAAQRADADLIVLSGDSHNGWAFDLKADGEPAGVEFAGHSVTSPGFESFAPGVPPADIAAAMIATNPELKWTDSSNRGYMSVELTPARATANWHMLETIRARSLALSNSVSRAVAHGEREIRAA